MTHANESKITRLAILILLGSISPAWDRIESVCTMAVIRHRNETVESTVNGFDACLESELAL